jgi:hypothetical protein
MTPDQLALDQAYFAQSSAIPATYITDWRIVKVAPGIVRLTVYERSYDKATEDAAIQTIIHVRGAFTMSDEAFAIFVDFANGLRAKWNEMANISAPTIEPEPGGRPN